MLNRVAVAMVIVVLGLSLGGCSKCGFFWQEGPQACKK
jgi:hypothetical protein